MQTLNLLYVDLIEKNRTCANDSEPLQYAILASSLMFMFSLLLYSNNTVYDEFNYGIIQHVPPFI